jgi:DNA-binding transcriptional LysR family regulator
MISKDLQLDWLRAFVAAVDTGSLTAAARQIYRSQSAVSMQLKKLEEVVGKPLLTRDPRRLSLTPVGADLLVYARRMLELHAEALAAIHGPHITGRIRLGVPDDYAMAYLTPVLRLFSTRYPNIEVTLVCEQSTALIPLIERSELDLAVVTRDHPGRGSLLFREGLVWVGAEQHEAWRRDPLPIAVHEVGSLARAIALAAVSAQKRNYRIVYHSPSVAGQHAAAASGMAIAVLTRCSVPPDLTILDARHGLPDLPDLDVALVRGKKSVRSQAVDAMHEQIVLALSKAIDQGEPLGR